MAQSDEKQRDRIEALRELARQQGAEAPPTDQAPAPAETFTQRARLTKRPRRWRLPLIADLLVAVILGSGAWWLWQRQATQLAPIPAELVLDLPAMKLFCPQSLAWSPDGNRVAVQLSDNTCSQQGAHLLAIFDARQGKLLQRFDLDLTLTRLGVTHVVRLAGRVWSATLVARWQAHHHALCLRAGTSVSTNKHVGTAPAPFG